MFWFMSKNGIQSSKMSLKLSFFFVFFCFFQFLSGYYFETWWKTLRRLGSWFPRNSILKDCKKKQTNKQRNYLLYLAVFKLLNIHKFRLTLLDWITNDVGIIEHSGLIQIYLFCSFSDFIMSSSYLLLVFCFVGLQLAGKTTLNDVIVVVHLIALVVYYMLFENMNWNSAGLLSMLVLASIS